jgi:transposase
MVPKVSGNMSSQLFAEASRHGLSHAAEVLVVADGAVWIWNLVNDRFPKAWQRLDLYHAKQHLWAVAEALHGAGTPAATE